MSSPNTQISNTPSDSAKPSPSPETRNTKHETPNPAIPHSSFPTPHSVNFQTIPESLKRASRWLLWRYERGPASPTHDAQWQKVPYRNCGRHAIPNDPRSWTTFPMVQDAYERHLRRKAPYDGIAFALGDNFAAIELTDVFNHQTQNTKHETLPSHQTLPWAAELVANFAGYTELTPDGRGLTLLVQGTFEGKNIEPVPHPGGGTIALRRQAYFVPITGRRWPENSRQNIVHRTDQLQQLARQLRSGAWCATACPESSRRDSAGASQTSGAAKPINAVQTSGAAKPINTVLTSGAAKPGNTALKNEQQDLEAHRTSGHIETPNTKHETLPGDSAPENSQPTDAKTIAELNRARAALRVEADQTRRLKAEFRSLIASQPREVLRDIANAKPISEEVPPPWSKAPSNPPTLNSEPQTPNTKHQTLKNHETPNTKHETLPGEPADERVADQIVQLALAEFRLGRTPADETFAVAIEGPNIAHMLRGGSAPLRKALARRFHNRYGRTLGSSALTDALNLIDAHAGELEPEQVHLRVACVPCATGSARALLTEELEQAPDNASGQIETQNTEHETLLKHETPSRELSSVNTTGIVIDLGRPDGKAVEVTASGWRILDRSPVLFRRTPLTAQLPLPAPGGRLDQFRSLVNVSDEGFQMLRGWLVAAMFPSIAHPILVLRGEQGTGKTTALHMLTGLVDPSTALALSEPGDAENWLLMAHGGWCLALDNVAGISPRFSEALCRAVTGQGAIRRRLYTDGDFAVIAFRRVLALTTINLGPIAEDLAARLLPVNLELIDKSARLLETRLLADFEACKPQIFGAILDEVATVLRNLPHVHLAEFPRMADFAGILAALPMPPGTPSEAMPLAIYLRLIDHLFQEVVESDPVVMALSELMASRQTWQGTATELLAAISKTGTNRGLPKSPRAMTVRLNRLESGLKSAGIAVGHDRATDYMRSRLIILTAIPNEPQ